MRRVAATWQRWRPHATVTLQHQAAAVHCRAAATAATSHDQHTSNRSTLGAAAEPQQRRGSRLRWAAAAVLAALTGCAVKVGIAAYPLMQAEYTPTEL